MRQIYPDLWVTEPEHPLPDLPDLMMCAYLLVRETGNVLFCRSEHHADHRHIQELGGITHQYLTHWHEAAPSLARIKQMFASKLVCHRLAEERVSKFSSVDVTFETRDVHLGDIEVIPSPRSHPWKHVLSLQVAARKDISVRGRHGIPEPRHVASGRVRGREQVRPETKPRDAAQRGPGRGAVRRRGCRRSVQGNVSCSVASRSG